MKKHDFAFLVLMVMALLPKAISAAANINVATTITWPFGLGTAGQLATFSKGTADYFSTNYVAVGTNLSYLAAVTTYSIPFTQFQPIVSQGAAASADGLLSFNLRPKTGLTFTPTKVTFDCTRYGTDNGLVDVIWKASDGTNTNIVLALKPARNNSGATSHAVYDLSALSIPASNGLCSLGFYVYGLANNKQFGLANIIFEGKTQGSPITVVTHTLATAVNPVGAGTVAVNPVGTTFDDSTVLTLTAPMKGMNIIRTRYDDCSVKVTKEMHTSRSAMR